MDFALNHAPAGIEDLLTSHLEFYRLVLAFYLAQHRRCRELTIWQEHGDESSCHEVEDLLLSIGEVRGDDTRGDDGVVVGDFRGVEDALRLLQRFAPDGLDELGVGCDTRKFSLVEAVERLRTLRVDIVGEVLRIHTGVGGVFLLVEALDEVERHLGREGELTVTVYL